MELEISSMHILSYGKLGCTRSRERNGWSLSIVAENNFQRGWVEWRYELSIPIKNFPLAASYSDVAPLYIEYSTVYTYNTYKCMYMYTYILYSPRATDLVCVI